jgi:hypothetical protein
MGRRALVFWLLPVVSLAAGCSSGNGMSPRRPGSGGQGGSSPDPCSGQYVDGSVASGPACAATLTSTCHLEVVPAGCTLDEACGQCAPLDGGASGCPIPTFVAGTTYDYVEFLDADVATVLVYDKNGMPVAELSWSANEASFGCAWSCAGGPANFDAREAMALLPMIGGSSLASACAARARDGGP